MTPCTLVQRQRRFGWTWFLRLRSFFSTEDEGIRSLRNVGIFHTRCMFQPNTTICYTKLCSRQHVSTLMSHHQAIQRTNPRYIIHWSAFWDPKILQWVVQLIAVVKKRKQSTPGPQCDRKDFMSMKNPVTPAGIESATIPFCSTAP